MACRRSLATPWRSIGLSMQPRMPGQNEKRPCAKVTWAAQYSNIIRWSSDRSEVRVKPSISRMRAFLG